MSPIEIIVILIAVFIVLGVIGNVVYRKVKHKGPSECACCQSGMKRAMQKFKKEMNSLK